MKWWKTRIYRDSVCTIRNNRSLPKQWKHWMKQMRVNKYDSEYRRTHYGKTHFCGRNRLFRINRFGEFQCSIPLEHFDRWSNSVGYTYPSIPQTGQEFEWVVKHMIEQTQDMQ